MEDLGCGLLPFLATLLIQNIHPTYAPCQLSLIFLVRAFPLSIIPSMSPLCWNIATQIVYSIVTKSEEGRIFVSVDSLLAPATSEVAPHNIKIEN